MEKLDKGKKGEDQALHYLVQQGYTLVTRNYTSLNAEIDLIVEKEEILVFVEVRVKATADYGFPEQSLSRAKINAIKRGATAYLFNKNLPKKVRFDMISIVEYPRWELKHFEDAFF
jgi:putative endonuclease